MDYDAGDNYKNVFQSGLDKNGSENLAEAAWGAAWDKESSWITSPTTGKRHIDWNAFEKNLTAVVRQQTGDINSTIGSFIQNSNKIDSGTFGRITGGVSGSISAGTPGAGITGFGAKVEATVKSDAGWEESSRKTYTADEVYRTIQNDHRKAIDDAKNSDGSINENKFKSYYSAKVNETARNYNEASKHAPSMLKGDIPKTPERIKENKPIDIPTAPNVSVPSTSLYNLTKEDKK